VIDEIMGLVLLGESLEDAVLVFPDAASQIGCYADVKAAGVAAHDVDVCAFAAHGE
jgi:hypothetical protein